MRMVAEDMNGQTSIEMIALLAGSLMVMLAAISILPEQTAAIGLELSVQDAQNAADRLAGAADEVYLGGEGAQKALWVVFPESYDPQNSFIGSNEPGGGWQQNRTVGIYVLGYGNVIAQSRAPICGSLPNESGKYLIKAVYNSSGHVMLNSTC